MNDAFQTGLEAATSEPPELLRKAQRFGLVCNQASLDRDFRHAAVLLQQRFPGRLAALFGPQHGLWSTEQDNMIETAHERDPRLGVPVHSLYSETRRPTAQMLDGLDLLVIDLQDVGTRVYTYVWTALYCLEECAKRRLPVLVLDRPNPLGGVAAEGPLLDRRFESFVGLAAIPMRHGLTIGELMQHLNRVHGIGCDLHVETCRFLKRSTLWPQLGRAWVPPSPNLPRVAGAFVYPGQVLLEGTQLSEGRGTTTPFEVFGAPWIDPWRLCDAMAEHELPGVVLRPIAFEPTFQKWQGERCGGAFVHATDPVALRSYRLTATLLRVVRQLWPTHFAWRQPPYEYEATLMPIDILAGGPSLRAFVDGELPWSALDAVTDAPNDWFATCEPDLIYR
ncbi:MAG: DUF1343 domain-containing protein [Planctomycetes bacterium]|nr:DUF1343 domain-containing protein [Planctomycetota bacterium]